MATVTPSLKLYQSKHRIQVEPTDDAGVWRCGVDGIRVHEGRRSWRHDTGELTDLVKEAFGGRWPNQELAIAAVSLLVASDVAREDAIEHGNLTFDR